MSERHRRKNAREMLTKAGYAAGGHFATEKMIGEAVHEHEGNLHKGEPKTRIKLADGGLASGGMTHHRSDHKPRGKHKKHHGKAHTQVNVIVGHQAPKPVPVPIPVPAGPPGGMPPDPAMAAGPPGMPPDAGGMPPPGMMPPGANRGGRFAKGGRTKELKAMMEKQPSESGRDPIKGMPRGQFKDGGKTKGYPIDDGAGGGEGRLEKKAAYGARV